MRHGEIIAQWMFAAFMAAVSFFCSLFLLALLFLELDGLPVGAKPPPDFHSSLSPTMVWIVVTSMLLVPLFVASYVGAITVPNSQLRLASVVFPLSIFLIDIVPSLGRAHQGFGIENLLETGASCAMAAVCLHFRWKRQQSRRDAAKTDKMIKVFDEP